MACLMTMRDMRPKRADDESNWKFTDLFIEGSPHLQQSFTSDWKCYVDFCILKRQNGLAVILLVQFAAFISIWLSLHTSKRVLQRYHFLL